MDEKKNPIQPASEHTPLDEAAAQVLKQSGGQAHHSESDAEQVAAKVDAHAGALPQSVPHQQFEAPSAEIQAPHAVPQKKSLLDVISDIFTLKWMKSNMRNKYGEDINKVRSAREGEKTQHLQNNPGSTYSAPQSAQKGAAQQNSEATPAPSSPTATPQPSAPTQPTPATGSAAPSQTTTAQSAQPTTSPSTSAQENAARNKEVSR